MRVTLLGSASAISTADRDNTYMVVQTNSELLLIDCAGSPAHKLLKAGMTLDWLDTCLLTHGHQDHTYGLIALIQEMKLLGRARPFHLYVPTPLLALVRRLLAVYDEGAPLTYELAYHGVEPGDDRPVLSRAELEIRATATDHSRGSTAYKIVERAGGVTRSLVYTADTRPSAAVVRFAQGADLLIHESTFLADTPESINTNHSTAREVGEIAHQAGVPRLLLVHLGERAIGHPDEVRRQVGESYKGELILGSDLLAIEV